MAISPEGAGGVGGEGREFDGVEFRQGVAAVFDDRFEDLVGVHLAQQQARAVEDTGPRLARQVRANGIPPSTARV